MFVKKLVFILSVFCCLEVCFAKDIPTENGGEKAMITCLREAINKDSELSSTQTRIIIGAGVSGAEAFKESANPNELHVLLTWQWLDCLKDIAKNTIIVVPAHAIDSKFQALENEGVTLISISGVLHTKTKDKIEKESITGIDASINYIVMLAGDTQQEDGKWIAYNKDMLSEFLNSLPTDKNILILNGPRTGKHLENSDKVDESAHRTTTDHITTAVQEKANEKWKIIDFKYGEKSQWDGALKFCLDNSKVGLILPGESTSMISEALSLGIKPIVYEHEAMTSTSRNYINQLEKEKKILEYPCALWHKDYAQEPSENQIQKIVKSLRSFIKK